MKTALILGVTGNFGQEMGKALERQGWKIKAIVRNRQNLTESQRGYNIAEGNFQDKKILQNASKDVDLIVYAVNPPYNQWHEHALSMLEPVVQLAEEKQLHILFPGNVYNFSPDSTAITESVHAEPVTAKGRIRVAMELRLFEASKSGARVTIIRGGDFIGRHSQWVDMILKKSKRNQHTMRFPHTSEHRHFWSYLPDLCANTAKIIEREKHTFEVWHDQGFVLTQDDWQQAFGQNGYALKITSFPWWLFSLFSYFVPLIREVVAMRYLWEETLILDGNKLRTELGERYQQTELKSIIKDLTA